MADDNVYSCLMSCRDVGGVGSGILLCLWH